jgi:GTP cyclohydrolase I
MPQTADRATLPDHASEADDRALPIDKVGIKGLRYPITVWDKERKRQDTVAELALSVGLPAHVKGTHMSRFLEVLEGHRGEISLSTAPVILGEIQRRLGADTTHLTVEFPYFLERSAPVSGARSLMDYACTFDATLSGSSLDFVLGVQVPVTTLCPCSKAVSRHGAHNQRGLVNVRLRFDGMVWIEDVVTAVEGCASSPLYALLKREDEKWVTERAYENPRFVEDMVREVALALRALPGVRWVEVEVENLESIHNHSAWAVLRWPNEHVPVAQATATAAPDHSHATFGAWLQAARAARGLTQRDLAAVIGLSPALLSRIERDLRTLPQAACDRLADAWGLSPEHLSLRTGRLSPALLARVQADPEGFLAWAERSGKGAPQPA